MSKHTELWTASEATEFLNSLQVAEFPIPHILRILKNTQSLQRIQQKLSNPQFQTGSDVFIDYVRNHFREKLHQEQPSLEGISLEEAIEDLMLSQMPSRRNKPPWEERIYEDAQNWSVLDATLFLDELESEWDMDIDTIMKRLNSTSFFSRATYIQFTSRLEVYIEYFDKNPVKKILQKTFIPFEKGDTENIRAMLDRVFTYFDFEKDLMVEILSNNLQVISHSNLDLFNRKTEWLEDFLGKGDRDRGKEEIKIIVREKKSLNTIHSIGIKLNRETDEYENETEFRMSFLKTRGGYTQEAVIDLFKSNPQAFSGGDLSDDKIGYLEEMLTVTNTNGRLRNGKTELDEVIQNGGFQGIVTFKIYKEDDPKNYVEFLKKRKLTPLQIADLFKSNPRAFSEGDISPHKISYLEELLTVTDTNGNMRNGQTELNEVIQNGGFHGIVTFKIYKDNKGDLTNEYVEFLKKRKLTRLQIADLFKSNPNAFSGRDISDDKISYLEEMLTVTDTNGRMRNGKTELDEVIQNGGFQGIVDFKVYKDNKGDFKNEYVEFLKKRKLTPLQIADLFKSNPNAFSGRDISDDKISYLEEMLTMTDTNGRMRNGKTELDEVIQNGGFQGIVDFKVYKDNKGDFKNEYVEFLKKRKLTPLQIADLFKSNPRAFSGGDLSLHKISYLEEMLTVTDTNGRLRNGQTELDWVIQNKSFVGIVDFKVYKDKKGDFKNEYVEFLKKRGLTPLQIADLFKSNPRAFSRGDLSSHKISYLEELLTVTDTNGRMRNGKTELDWVIQNGGFLGIVTFKVYKEDDPKNYVELLKKRKLTRLQIADLFKSNPQAFSGGDLSLHKISYLEELLTVTDTNGRMRNGQTELDWVIQNKSFVGIVNFKVYKNKDDQLENKHVKFLKSRGFTPLQIADLFKSNPHAFSRGDLSPHKISYLEEYLGKGDRNIGKKKLDHIILKKGGFKALVLFEYNINAQPANTIIDFLENGMHFNQDQVVKIMEDHFSELFVEDLTEETSKEYIERLIKKIPDICQESLSS